MYHSLLSLVMIAPDSAEMHMLMAGELGRQGDHVDAIAQYREAIRLNPASLERISSRRTTRGPLQTPR